MITAYPGGTAAARKQPQLMGILNVTPDSFSDGGTYSTVEAAVLRGTAMLQIGTAIVDVGGESTAPGNDPVGGAEELARVLPVVTALAPMGFISVDTYRSETAEQCLHAGARMINDVSALRADKRMAAVVAEHQAAVVLMHSKEADDAPHASESRRDYGDVVAEIADFLMRRCDAALAAGIAEDKILLDPGMGRFISHDGEYSWRVLHEFERFVERVKPFRVLVGVSRKGFLGGKLAARDPVSQLCGLAAAIKGASVLRTHAPEMAVEFFSCWERLFGRAESR